MFGVIGIVLSLALLIFLAYKGWSVILIAPVLALLATSFVLLDGGSIHLLATYTEVFMVNLANYVKNYFPIFMLGAIFERSWMIQGQLDLLPCLYQPKSDVVKKYGPWL